ncbi:hypothetical protein ACS0TY_023674 [Phlomoides rotata]
MRFRQQAQARITLDIGWASGAAHLRDAANSTQTRLYLAMRRSRLSTHGRFKALPRRGEQHFGGGVGLSFSLSRALEAGLGSVQVETDSEILVKVCKGECTAETYVTALVEDIKSMGNTVQGIEFLHARRDANKVAHTLALYAPSPNFEQIWIEEIPDICNSFILKDVRREPNSR